MSRFGDVDDQYDPHAIEERVFEYWNEVDAYERTKQHRADGESFFFVDGPPYTSGAAHMGTTWNKSLKDVYIRYKRMQGFDVTDRPGYDMHGLPIETKVEEKLGFENKKDIEEFGEENFIEACKEYADEQLEGLQSDFKSFGVWMDWEDPYKTVNPEYMEAAWWGFSKAADRGLVEQGQRSISQCPRCETGLANNEVEYEDVEDPSVYVKFDLVDREGSIVIWTTTPWTIPANAFTAVDPDLEYAAVRGFKDGEGEVIYVAEACVEAVLKKGRYDDYEVLETLEGSEMIGWEYEHPLAEEVPDHADHDGVHQIYAADYVEADRTGLVHSAPGHGEEDFVRGRELGFPIFCPVGSDGVYTDEGGKYAGQFVKDADDEIIADLEANGAMLASEHVHHSYGHCWRCDTGIIQIVTDQWFITITDVKDELLDNIDDSEWYPEWARDSRFRDFVEEAPDWNVSRQRYWGIPIPIWTPEGRDDGAAAAANHERASGRADDEEMIVISTREELAERVDQDIDPDTVDIHKDTVDDLTITEDGTTYTRVPDVFDVWLDSSVASWGTLNFPEDDNQFEELWPADFILEAHDQTRGWFWSQLGMGTAAMGEVPYDKVLMHGHALDEDGRKMSKSVGNVVEPHEAIDRHGSDAMRMFLLSANPQGDDMRFSWDGMRTMENNLRTLWNVFRFPLPYMRLDGFDPTETTLDAVDEDLELVDEWILARLQSTKAEMTEHFEEFRQDRALEALLEFVLEDVSRFYVQAVRERMWAEADSPSKSAAYATIYRVLEEVVVLLAPFAPFVTEEIYGTLTGNDGHPTVHMHDWPAVEEYWADSELETDVAYVRAVEEAGAHARQQAGRKLRWPVGRVVVAANDERVVEAVNRHESLVADRLNARDVELVEPGQQWGELAYSAEADMSKLGPAFGGRAGEVMNALNEARIDEASLEALQSAVDDVLEDGEELTEDMVSFVTQTPDDIAGTPFGLESEEAGVVYVDATLTDDIESEGYAREVIRRVQEMRKELDLDVEERIVLELEIEDDRVADLVAEREDLIREEVRADELRTVDVDNGQRKTWDVEGVSVELALEPVAADVSN